MVQEAERPSQDHAVCELSPSATLEDQLGPLHGSPGFVWVVRLLKACSVSVVLKCLCAVEGTCKQTLGPILGHLDSVGSGRAQDLMFLTSQEMLMLLVQGLHS